jgi:peptide/nickel transport system substrate-binding protein
MMLCVMRLLFDIRRTPRWAALLLGLALLLPACAIEGGVPPATPAAIAPTLGPAPTDPAVAAARAARADTWMIGLLDRPQDLYPYQPGPTAQRVAAPITELLFPSPILAYNYAYTSTGVLDRLPTLENGDALLRKQDVYLDAAGTITTTATDVITQVDQLVVTFHWNPKLAWSDGTPVTADDSVFAYELAKAAPPSEEIRDRLSQELAYERVDDHTTRATLRPDFTDPTYFLHYWIPLPRHLLQGVDPATIRESEFATKPVGYGPYAIESVGEREITMTRNQHYFGQHPFASRLTVAFQPNADIMRAGLLNGNLDVAATDRPPAELLPELDRDKAERRMLRYYQPNPIWEHIDFNLDVPELQDGRIRHAIALGTNRKQMIETLFGGNSVLLHSWILPDQPNAAPPDQITRYDYNPDEARRLLDEAGYLVPEGGDGMRTSQDGITLTLTLLTTESPALRTQVAEMFRQDMRAIGIDIQIQPLPSGALFDSEGPLFQRQFDMVLFGWIARPDAGGAELWSCAAIPNPENGFVGDNFSGWCQRDANRAIREAATTLDPAQRAAAYLRQQQIWTQDLPALPLFQRLSAVLASRGVRGPQADPLAPITWNIATWDRIEQ